MGWLNVNISCFLGSTAELTGIIQNNRGKLVSKFKGDLLCDFVSYSLSLNLFSLKSNSLSIIHMNICFSQKTFECLYDYLCLLPNFFKMICPTATGLKRQLIIKIDLITSYLMTILRLQQEEF